MIAEFHNKILVASAAIAVGVGVYIPWLKINPNLPPDAEIPTIYITGLSAGVEGIDFALLGTVGLVILLRAIGFQTPIYPIGAIVVGVGTTVFPVYFLAYSTLLGFSATFVPALGWYLTVLGGVLFVVAGGLQLPSVVHRPMATVRLKA